MRCQFEIQDLRCPKLGTLSAGVGRKAAWVCAHHLTNVDRNAEAYVELRRMIEEHDAEAEAERRQSWQENLVRERMSELDLARREDEDREAFVERCLMAMPDCALKRRLMRQREA